MQYVWRCLNCGHKVVVDRKMADYNLAPNESETAELTSCAHEWQKVIEASTFILQGSGWAKDGYDGLGNMKVTSK